MPRQWASGPEPHWPGRILLVAAAVSGLTFLSSTLFVSSPSRAAASASPDVVLYEEDFDDGETQGWGIPSGWAIVAGEAGKVLQGTGQEVASYFEDDWGDCTFAVRVRIEQGVVHLIYRAGDCTRYFIDFAEGRLVLNRTSPCGTHTELASRTGKWKERRWYELAVTGSAGTIAIAIDGSTRLTYTDRDPILYGHIGLAVPGDSRALFDDVRITGRQPDLRLTWIRTGGPLGGLGYDIRVNPGNPDILYVTDVFSGVSKSTDGGRTWAPSNSGITSRTGPSGDAIPIFCLTIDPHDPDIIWAGTLNTRGIFRSADGGSTWVEKDKGIVEGEGITFRGFTVDPRSSDIVYAAGDLSSFLWAGQELRGKSFDRKKGVVYKTVDGGENWTPIWRGDNLARYIWIDPRDPDTLYVSTGIFDCEAANCDPSRPDPAGAGGVGVLKSVDGGHTWRTLDRKNGLENLYIGSLFMHPENPDLLLAAAGNHAWRQASGVYLSEDGGETWKLVLDGGGDAFSAVEFSLSNPSIAYAVSGGVFRSNDGGTTWKKVNQREVWGPEGIRAGIGIDIQVDPRNADRLFVNNYGGGNFLSEDGGRTWASASTGYTGAQLRDISVAASDSQLVYVIGRSGPFCSHDGGMTWEGINYGPVTSSEWAIQVCPSDPLWVVASDMREGLIFLSRDGGQTWVITLRQPQVNAQGSTAETWHGFKSIAYAPADDRIVYAAMSRSEGCADRDACPPSYGIYRSDDRGVSWHDVNSPVSLQWNANVVAVNPQNADVVWVGTVGGGVIKTMDGGKAWESSSVGLGATDVRSLAVDPANPDIVYAGGRGSGLWASSDAGESWKRCGVGIGAEADVRDIVVDPTDSRLVYAADYQTGVYRSNDAGETWVRITNGLTTRAVGALALSSDGETLYAATEGEGVFRLDLRASGGSD